MKKSITFCLFLFLFAGLKAENTAVIEQLTTHPDGDFEAVVSPDGKWLAFVSRRSGNLDIWIKALPRGKAIQITSHKSEDRQPAWSPDSRQLAFMSRRRDAAGDLWTVKLKRTKGQLRPETAPVQRTRYLGRDNDPCFSHDGKELVFVSDRNGQSNLWALSLSKETLRPLTFRGGSSPQWSPVSSWVVFASSRNNAADDLFLLNAQNPEEADSPAVRAYPLTLSTAIDGQPAWSSDGRSIVFVRWQTDSDGDGIVSPLDHGLFYRKTLTSGDSLNVRQIILGRGEDPVTTGYFQDTHPCLNQNKLIFTSNRGKGLDVWQMPDMGLFSKAPSAYGQYTQVLEEFGEMSETPDLWTANLGLAKVRLYFPHDSIYCARALLLRGDNFRVLGEADSARAVYEDLISLYPTQRKTAAVAMLRLAHFEDDSADMRQQRFEWVVNHFQEFPSITAEAWVGLGDMHQTARESGKALAAYGEALNCEGNDNTQAMIQMKIGSLLQKTGQMETARQHYLAVLREYGHIPLWRSRSLDQILALIDESSDNAIQDYRLTIQEAHDMPDLQAQCSLRIASLLEGQEKHAEAIRELERLRQESTLGWVQARTRLRMAALYVLSGDELKGILLLEAGLNDLKTVDGGSYIPETQAALFKILFQSAELLRETGDYALGAARYQKCLHIDDQHIPSHRGLIECEARRGQIASKIDWYEAQLKDKPDDSVLLYALGLCLSYAGERDENVLLRSNQILKQSLEKDYRLIYPYRTLSYNYELLEQLNAVNETRQPHVIVRSLLAPLKWVKKQIFRGRERPVQYYEEAIDVLTTAIELNDESADPDMETLLIQNLANNFYHLGEFGYQKAYNYYQARLSLDTTFTNPLAKAVFYARAGHAGLIIDEHEGAEKCLKKAIEIYQSLRRDADVLHNERMLAFSCFLDENYEAAVDHYDRVARKERQQKAWDMLERSYRMLAFNFYKMGEPEDCLRYASMAEQLLDQWDAGYTVDRKDALRIGLFGITIPVWRMEDIGGASSEGFSPADERALIYRLQSQAYEMLKEYGQAAAYEEKRLFLFKEIKNETGRRMTLSQLGRLHYKTGQLEKAWDYFNRARKACRKAEDDRGEWINLQNMANVAHARRDRDGQPSYDERLLRLLNRFEKENEELLQSDRNQMVLKNHEGLLRLAAVSKEMHADASVETLVRLSLARMDSLVRTGDCFKTVLRLAKKHQDLRTCGVMHKHLAVVAESSGDLDSACDHLLQSRDYFYRNGDEDLLWRVELAAAVQIEKIMASDSLYVPEKKAVYYYTEAMNHLESLPVDEDYGDELLADRFDRMMLFEKAALAYARHGNFQQSLEAFERARQKETADLIGRKPPVMRWERHKIAWGNLRFLRSRLLELRLDQKEESRNRRRQLVLRDIQKEIDRYTVEYAGILKEMQQEDPVLAYLTGSYQIRIRDIRSELDKNIGVMVYMPYGRQIIAWYVDKYQIKGRIVSNLSSNAASRYHQLIKPFEAYWQSKKQLVIIPGSGLWDIPFEALTDDSGMALRDLIPVSFAPSLVTYSLAEKRRRINQSIYGLAGTVHDAALIKAADVFEKADGRLGAKAGHQALKSLAHQTDILQIERPFTRHRDPLMSAFILAADSSRSPLLPIRDMFSWHLKPSLMMMSTPFSASDRLPLQLLYACCLYGGTPSLMVQTRPLNHEQKADFAAAFFQQLNQYPISEALLIAEDQLMKDSESASLPVYRLIGFQGMDASERIAFARENMVQTVLRARGIEKKKEFRDAVVQYQHAEVMARTLNDSLSQSRIASEIIRAAYQGGDWETAIAYQQQLLGRARISGRSASILKGLKNLVAFHVKAGRFEEAAELKKAYLDGLNASGNVAAVAEAYEELAFIYTADRQYEQAIQGAEEAFSLYEGLGDRAGQGRAMVRKGRFYLEGEFYWQAVQTLNQAVALLDSIQLTVELKREYATAHQLMGLAYENLTRYEDALEVQQKAFALFETLNMNRPAAQGKQYIANIYWKMGKYAEALQAQTTALETFNALSDQKGLAMAYSTQGLIQLSLGEVEEARSSEEKALSLAEQGGFKADQAAILKNIGLIHIQDDADQLAYASFAQAAAIDSSLKLKKGLAYDYRNMGNVLTRLNREDGIGFLQRATQLSKQLQDNRNLIHCYLGRAKARHHFNQYEAALACIDSALMVSAALSVPDLRWRLYRLKGNVLAAKKHGEEAVLAYQQAIEIVEQMRAELKVEGFQQGFLDSKMDLYEDMIALLVGQKKVKMAFDYVERAKSRSFIDMLANRNVLLPELDSHQIESLNAVKLTIEEVQASMARLSMDKTLPVDDRERMRRDYEQELADLRDSYQMRLTRVQSENAELASLISVQPVSMEAVQHRLQPNAGILEFYVASNTLYCWVLTSQGAKVHQAALNPVEAEGLIRRFRQGLQAYLSVDEDSRQLYDLLLKPIVETLDEAIEHLIIVPHGALHYVPFAALMDSRGQYLLDQYALSIVPSSTVLGYCTDKGDAWLTRPVKQVVALGNPDLDDAAMDLPFAEKEIRALTRSWPKVQTYIGKNASESQLYSQSSEADILHLACHGEYEPLNPLFSALLLCPDSTRDGRLEAHEIFGLDLDCRLVCLSACETGVSKITKGDEIIGLARGFLFAGTPSVITSLWKVDDLATAVLMKRFYRYLSQGDSRGEALRKAQLLVRQSVNQHPAAWAAFTLTGDFR